jgi:spore germination cell wall hydrolase CwlJ-like protein
MTDDEQKVILLRGATVAVCAVAVTVSLPMIGQNQTEKRAEADFREQAVRLAQIEDGGATVRTADHSASLLDHPWLRTVEYTLERDTDASMSRYAMRDRDGAALQSLVSFRPEHLKRAENIDAEHMCLSQAVYYESAHEPLEGQLAVAEVIANRTRDHRYPDTICGVVYQGATRTTGCQFTFTCDGALDRQPVGENWERAKKIAAHVLMNLNEERTGGATHYHATYVNPIWNAGLIKTDKIGLHIFYRFPRGAEWATVRQDWTSKRATVRKASVQKAPAPSANDAAESVIISASAETSPSVRTVSYATTAPIRTYTTLPAASGSENSVTTSSMP